MTQTTQTQTAGDWLLGGLLGRGAMGAVYRAHKPTTGGVAAIKRVTESSEDTYAAMRREIDVLRGMQHPGIIRLLDDGDDGAPWYAMELVDGVSLRTYLRGLSLSGDTDPSDWWTDALKSTVSVLAENPIGPVAEISAIAANDQSTQPLDLRGRLTILSRLLPPIRDSLAYLHARGVVHCDLKPENILLAAADRPVLVDFGVAVRGSGADGRTVLDVASGQRGTVAYMAPEQIRGVGVDARTDIYALGCVMFEILSGRPPFRGTHAEVLRAHVHVEAPPIQQFAPDTPAELAELLAAMLHKDARMRPPHVADVATWLGSDDDAAKVAPSAVEIGALHDAPLSGRDDQLQWLQGHVATLRAGAGGGVLVLGRSGIGKTRLAREIGRSAAQSGISVFVAECEPLRVLGAGPRGPRGGALGPLRPVLTALIDRWRAGNLEGLGTALGPLALPLASIEPGFAEVADADYVAMDPTPDALRSQLVAGAVGAVLHASRAARLLLIVDDVQWADELTLLALGGLVRRASEGAVLLLALAREEEFTSAHGERLGIVAANRLQLSNLSDDALAHILADTLGVQLPGRIVAHICAGSAGSPLFAGEMLRAAIERGALARISGGGWDVRDDSRLPTGGADLGGDLPMPESVGAMVLSRIRLLSPAAQEVLEVAAAAGRISTPQVLGAVVAADRLELGLRELQDRGVLVPVRTGLRLSHDKLREAAYERIDPERRRHIHAALATQMQAELGSTRPGDEALALLCHHHDLAGHVQRSVELLDELADRAFQIGAYEDARRATVRALELAGTLHGDAAATLTQARRHRRLADACSWTGDLREAALHVDRALALLADPLPSSQMMWLLRGVREAIVQPIALLARPTASDAKAARLTERGLAAGCAAERFFYTGDLTEMIVSTLISVNLLLRAGSRMSLSRSFARLGLMAGLLRLKALGGYYFRRARDAGRQTEDWANLITSYSLEATSHMGFGRWIRALEASTASRQLAQRLGDPQHLEVLDTVEALCFYFSARFPAALERQRRVLASARARGNSQHEAWGLFGIGYNLFALGQVDEASEHFERAAPLIDATDDEGSRAVCHGARATLAVWQGNLSRANAAADIIERIVTTSPQPMFVTLHGYGGLAETRIATWRASTDASPTPPESVRTALKHLRAFARIHPMARPRLHLMCGRVAAAAGNGRAAARHLDGSLRLARRMGMRYDAAMALAELAGLKQMSQIRSVELRDSAIGIFDSLGCEAWVERLVAQRG